MDDHLLDKVAEAIWKASSTFGLARSWAEESLPVRMGFLCQAEAALGVIHSGGLTFQG